MIPRISQTAKKSTKTVLQEADKTRSSINRICKSQAIFSRHVKRREKLQHLVTTGMIVQKTASKDIGWTKKRLKQGVQKHSNLKFPTFSKNFLPRILKENPK